MLTALKGRYGRGIAVIRLSERCHATLIKPPPRILYILLFTWR